MIVCENEVAKFPAGGVATHLQLHFTGVCSVSATHQLILLFTFALRKFAAIQYHSLSMKLQG